MFEDEGLDLGGGEDTGEDDVGGEENNTPEPSWKDSLPDDIKGEASFNRFDGESWVDSYGKLYKSWRSASNKISQKGVIIPKDDNPEEWSEVYKQLGRPDDTDGYELELPEDYPEEFKSDNFDNVFKEAVHDAGLNQKQADKLYKTVMEKNKDTLGNINEQRKTSYEKAANDLKKEWANDFKHNTLLVQKAVNEFGGEEVKEMFNSDPSLGNNPIIAKMIYNMASAMSEDIIAKGGISSMVTSPSQAEAKLREIDGDMNHPYWKGDKEAVKNYQDLVKLSLKQ